MAPGGDSRYSQDMAERTVDARGKFCPVPILELSKAMREAGDGDELRLLATDPAVEPDVKAYCAATGHELLSLAREGDGWAVRIRKRPLSG